MTKTESTGKSNGPYDPLPQVAKISKESKLLCFDESITDIGDAVILKGLFLAIHQGCRCRYFKPCSKELTKVV